MGGSLDLEGLTSIPEGFNPTVGGSFYLRGLTSIPEGFNPTVGGSLDLRGYLRRWVHAHKPPAILTWKGEEYCNADGMFGEVVSKRTYEGMEVWKLRKVNKDEIFYLVEQEGFTAHGSSVKEAVIDLRFKTEKRDKSDYEDLTPESEISFEDAVICYRVITGACSFGVSDFLKNRLKVNKDRYQVKEIIDLVKGEYGSDAFARFFQPC